MEDLQVTRPSQVKDWMKLKEYQLGKRTLAIIQAYYVRAQRSQDHQDIAMIIDTNLLVIP